MPPPSTHSCLDLTLYPELYFVSQVKEITADLFKSFSTGRFFSVTRTSDEISIVGEAGDDMPVEEAKWRCIRIAGPMDFGMIEISPPHIALSHTLRRLDECGCISDNTFGPERNTSICSFDIVRHITLAFFFTNNVLLAIRTIYSYQKRKLKRL
jgi:hypothetical protein